METQFNGREMLFVGDAISLSGTGTHVSASTLLFRGSSFVRALSRAIKSATITLTTREIFVPFHRISFCIVGTAERRCTSGTFHRLCRFVVHSDNGFHRGGSGNATEKVRGERSRFLSRSLFCGFFFFRDAEVEKFREYSLERTGEGFMRLIRHGRAGRIRFTPQVTTFFSTVALVV